jgi:hypothetical protein
MQNCIPNSKTLRKLEKNSQHKSYYPKSKKKWSFPLVLPTVKVFGYSFFVVNLFLNLVNDF